MKLDFQNQKNKWDQILRDRKYRPSFFGLSVHFDWKIILLFIVMVLVLNLFFGLSVQKKINLVTGRDYSVDSSVKGPESVKLERFDDILKKIEK